MKAPAPLPDARAEAMAPALHAELGDLVQVVSQSSFDKDYDGGGPNYCSQPVTLESAVHSYFSSFDAGANGEVEISAAVSLTYAISERICAMPSILFSGLAPA